MTTVQDHGSSGQVRGYTVLIDGQFIPAHYDPRCTVCSAPERPIIERGLMLGWSYRSIAESVPKDSQLWRDRKTWEEVDYTAAVRRIGKHARNDHSIRDTAIARTSMEAWAEKSNLKIDTDKGSIVTEMGLLNEMMRRGYERMVETGASPSIGQTITAAQIMLQYREAAGETSAAVFQKALEAAFKIITERFGEEAVQLIYSDLQSSPEVMEAVEVMAIEAGDN